VVLLLDFLLQLSHVSLFLFVLLFSSFADLLPVSFVHSFREYVVFFRLNLASVPVSPDDIVLMCRMTFSCFSLDFFPLYFPPFDNQVWEGMPGNFLKSLSIPNMRDFVKIA